jgi:hypothetical protein
LYEEGNRLQTEHAVLDDNGDGLGTHDSSDSEGESSDGSLAVSAFLAGESGERTRDYTAVEDPELAELYRQVRALEDRVEGLKRQKEGMSEDLYLEELEKLLLELALKNREVKELEQKLKERNEP